MRFLMVIVLAACGTESEPKAEKAVEPARSKEAESKEPRIEPIIGTRVEQDGPLTPVLETKRGSSSYIGCDLKYENLAKGTEIELVWLFKPPAITKPVEVIHGGLFRIIDSDRGDPKRAWVDRVNDDPIGSYECVWTIGPRGSSARLVVK